MLATTTIADEPVVTVTITVPVRALPQLVAIVAAAATPADKPCVQTTAEEPAGPGVVKASPSNIVPLRRAV